MQNPRLLKKTLSIALLVFALMVSTSVVSQDLDIDENGFRDAYERQIANKFCPCLFLNTTEYFERGLNTLPSPVEIMTQNLWAECFNVSVSTGGGIYHNGEANYDYLLDANYSWINNNNIESILDYSYANCVYFPVSHVQYHLEYAGTSNNCDPYGGPGDDPFGDYGWYKYYRIDDQAGAIYPLTVYAHLFTAEQEGQYHGKLIVQYWIFYPFNEWVNDHEGDWEHIDLIVSSDDPDSAFIEEAYYYFHKSCISLGQPQAPGVQDFDFYVVDDSHPVVFVGGFGRKEFWGAKGEGFASHGNYPIWGPWSEVSFTSQFTIDEGISTKDPGTGQYIYHPINGNPNWIYWTDFVRATTPDGRYGVVILKEPDQYDYDDPSGPNMSWLKANIYWGHIKVNSMGVSQGDWMPWLQDNVGNRAPFGPAHQWGWSYVGSCNDKVHYYTMPLPNGWGHVSDAGWIAPPGPCYDTDTPVVTVESPNGGEHYHTPEIIPITWQVEDEFLSGIRCCVYLNYNGGSGDWTVLAMDIPVNSDGYGHFDYRIHHGILTYDNCRIQVCANDSCGARQGCDMSYGDFTIELRDKPGDELPIPREYLNRVVALKDDFLNAPFPNPFNPQTSIQFGLKKPTQVSLVIYDVTGARVRTFYKNVSLAAGEYVENWNGRNDKGIHVSSGIYFLQLQAGNFSKTQRMILLR